MRKIILIFLFFLCISSLLQAQKLNNQTFKTKEDYFEHQIQVEKGLKNWFDYNPLEKDNTTIQLRNILQVYLMDWLRGAPQISLIIDGKIEEKIILDKKFDYTQDLFLAMIFSKTTYLLENKEAKSTDFDTNLAGVKGMLIIYKKIKKQAKNKRKYRTEAMEKYLEWEKNGTLEENVKEIINDK